MTTPGRPGAQLPYRYLAGVEPCPGGWLLAAGRLQGITLFPEDPIVFATFAEILDQRPAYEILALHCPVGLLDEPRDGGRACERAARRLLGWPRMAAVVPSPLRPALAARTWKQAVKLNGGGMSPVTWALLDHVAELNSEMQPYRQRQVSEVHPELAFYELNGSAPLPLPKHHTEGRRLREELLAAKFRGVERILQAKLPGVSREHLVDVAADLWTARRIAARSLHRLPDTPEWDANGLRMEIVY